MPSGGNPSHVRNEGWHDAQGNVVHFLDDRVLPGACRDGLAAFQARRGVGVAFGRVMPFGTHPCVLERERHVIGHGHDGTGVFAIKVFEELLLGWL